MEVLPMNAIHPVYAMEGEPRFPVFKNGKFYLRTENGWVRAMENATRSGYYIPYTSIGVSGNSGKGVKTGIAAAAANANANANIDPNNLYRGGKRRKTRRIRKSRRYTRK
jgi:hypothetical protein